MAEKRKGIVYLVGAGPGDPGLLTLRGRECLSRADVVVYDQLANRVFLSHAGRGARLIYAGKRGGDHALPQDEINALIVREAGEGHTVVRLKGGDPFIFGRGGEEAQELARAGVPFEVVPGVTSAIAVPAYAGIPLTHRDHTSTVAFITGHEDPLKEESRIAWEKLATGAGTLVFLMGVGNLPRIVERLLAHGRAGSTPVAVIGRGTVPEQRTVLGDLESISGLAAAAGVKPPAVIVVGEVVGLRGELNWFESRPLFGKRIVVTRAREQASGFLKRLTELGAEGIEFPTIAIAPPESWDPLDEAIRSLEAYHWAVFTSVNGVKSFLGRLAAAGKDLRDLKGLKIAAIGPGTAEGWESRGIRPDLVPGEYRAEALVEFFRTRDPQGMKILVPRAAKAREVLPRELEKMGARVDVVPAYQTVRPEQDSEAVRQALQAGRIDLVTFTSSSTVENFLSMFGGRAPEIVEALGAVPIACIGPITADTARRNGLQVTLVPEDYTIEALTEAVVRFFAR